MQNIRIREIANKYTNLLSFLALYVLLIILTGGKILSWDNTKTLIISVSVQVFAALGVGMIIITRGIDLSIGYVICFSASMAVSFAQIPEYQTAMYHGTSFPLFVPVIAGIAAGGVFGLFNGTLVAYGKLPPFIATLGTMSIARGMQLLYTKAVILGNLKPEYTEIAKKAFGPSSFQIPILAIYVIVITCVIYILLKHTKQGTNFYAIGGNAQAARVSGINVERNLLCVYFYAGLLYGAAGVLLSSRLAMASPLTAMGYELDAIAAVTVGGISQTGGVGTVFGMLIGVFIMGLISYGMSFLGMDPYYQHLVKGGIIIIAVYFDMKKYAKRA